MLDTETFEWTELTAENCTGPFPEGRAGHRMVAIRDKLFLFGGGVWDKSRRSWLAKINATHVFDPRTWARPAPFSSSGSFPSPPPHIHNTQSRERGSNRR